MTSLGQRPSASVAPAPALAYPGLAHLSLRLSTVLTEHDVSLDTQSQLGDAGYVSVSLFSALGHDHPTFMESLTLASTRRWAPMVRRAPSSGLSELV
jgi:hypothetical protein